MPDNKPGKGEFELFDLCVTVEKIDGNQVGFWESGRGDGESWLLKEPFE